MSDEKRTTVVQSLVLGPMVKAEVIRTSTAPETAAGAQPVRTVATSKTSGNVSIRYAPRPSQPSGNVDTTS
jgi:hypothetical protein